MHYTVHKILYKKSAPYLGNIFQKNNNKTRAGEDTISLVVKKVTKVNNEHIYAHCASKLWNQIPQEIRSIEKHNIFRNKLFNYFIEYQKLYQI